MAMAHTHLARTLRAIAVVNAVGIGLVPSTALGASGWSSPANIDSTGLVSVSCPTASFCAAVDNSGYALTYDGTKWSAPADVDLANSLVSVSCPSASFCLAVDAVGNALTYNGSTWSAPASTGAVNMLTSVSCASASFCAAVTAGGSGTGASALTYNGSAWSAPAYFNYQVDAFGSVSCPSASFCVAVGTNYSGSSGLAAWIYNGSSWSAMTVSDPGTDSAYVSCPSASFCAAVDSAGNALTYSGGSWSAPTNINGPNSLGSVSCPSALVCVTVADENVLAYDGSSWSAPAPIDTTGHPLNSVSCPSTAFCAAVDGSGNALTYTGSAATTYRLAITVQGSGTGAVYTVGRPCANKNGTTVTCTTLLAAGGRLTLDPVPGKDSVFAGWGGDCTGTSVTGCQVTMSSDHNVTAMFRCGFKLSLPHRQAGSRVLRLWVSIRGRRLLTLTGLPLRRALRNPPDVYLPPGRSVVVVSALVRTGRSTFVVSTHRAFSC